MNNKARFERLKELERRRERLGKFFTEVKSYPYTVFSNQPAKRDEFYEQDENSKRVSAMSQTLDVPPDIDARRLILDAAEALSKSLDKEFSDLLNS